MRGRPGVRKMPSSEEREIVEQLDREVSDRGSLVALVCCMIVVAGFALAVFPVEFKELLVEADPRMLQFAGLAETVLVAGVMAMLLLG